MTDVQALIWAVAVVAVVAIICATVREVMR